MELRVLQYPDAATRARLYSATPPRPPRLRFVPFVPVRSALPRELTGSDLLSSVVDKKKKKVRFADTVEEGDEDDDADEE